MPATVEVRMTGDGSAIMHVLGKDSPYEMVTMIHPDGKRLLATHYCAAHNQPRSRSRRRRREPDHVELHRRDQRRTRRRAVRSVVFTFVDANHREDRGQLGQLEASALQFTRKKSAPDAGSHPRVTGVPSA